MHFIDRYELLAELQACMIYSIMYIVAYTVEDEPYLQEVLVALAVWSLLVRIELRLIYTGYIPYVQR